ncbi:unnamed protein product [Caenorhabditis angaria]|uniref:Uncharacterized protein n=1 Tax=Caenorhabditis angaria TaxID=860376 RepID=A0A9P1IVA9_9PELO|nr:unnamed protein product [Caenorhabditis angaria]
MLHKILTFLLILASASAYYLSYMPRGGENEGYSAYYYADLGRSNLQPENAPIDPDRTNFYYSPNSESYNTVNHQYTFGK